MKTLAAASLTCLLLLGGCTLSPLVSKLSTKPTPPAATRRRTASSSKSTSVPAKAPAPRTATAPAAAPAALPAAAPAAAKAAPASAVTGRPSLGIAPDEIPSPGECRLWMPGVPPESQSPSGTCSVVQQNVPAGAWVLHRSEEKSNEVAVNVYRSKWPRTISETRYFDYWTGTFLRAE